MTLRHWRRPVLAGLLAVTCTALSAAQFVHPDHAEFNAMVGAPFKAQAGRFPIVLHFDYPFAGRATDAAWSLQALAPDGRVVRTWQGLTSLSGMQGKATVSWNGRDAAGRGLVAGYYRLQLRAVPTVVQSRDAARSVQSLVAESFAAFPDEVIVQDTDVMVGALAPARMPAFRGLHVNSKSPQPRQPTATNNTLGGPSLTTQSLTASGLPYTIYYGNMHSQTNHSDGGAPVAQCTGASAPQSGTYGPTDAYTMMETKAGGDFLLASEHNHMYDGSTGTNSSAVPADAIALFHNGLKLASDYNTAHPGFLALYGLEWGVISNGGHLNLINPDALAEWELNGSGQLIGEVNTPKSDYAALYTTMKARGWIGQFNHAATTGQFIIGGTPLAYDANGAQVMVLAEIINSSAFSTNTTQTETSRSSYVSAWNILLERGYKVAPSTDQDNHCANWGLSFTNRTGVLLPDGVALTTTNFVDALRARRVFATEDKSGQLVLTANGHVMGETFSNSGTLTLTANYASSNGQTAQRVQFFQGVPGRNGTVTQLTEGSGSYAFTPANGQHFYYAQVTQANGLNLWSAPIWVSQGTSTGDTTAPTVSASESGSSGTITLSATASDNVGVSKVEFYVDGVLKGSDTTSPYSMTLDSTTLTNASHTLVAKAYDAAGNVGTSTSVAFTVSNTTASSQLVLNGGFESGSTSWTASSGVVDNTTTYAAHAGSYKAWLNGYGTTHTDYAYQTVTIPATLTTATLSLWLRVATNETTTTTAYDTIKVQLRDTSNKVLATLATYSNLNSGSSYVQRSFSVAAYKGKTVRVYVEGIEDSSLSTSFLVDDVSLLVQ